MTKAELGAIISKTFAIFYFFKFAYLLLTNALSTLFSHIVLEGYQMQPETIVWLATSMVLYSALTLCFWFGAEALGKLIAGKENDKKVSLPAPEQFMACIFVAFGCFLLSKAIPHASKLLAAFFHDEPIQEIFTQHNTVAEDAMSLAFYCILSLVFILGANRLQKAILSLRNMG